MVERIGERCECADSTVGVERVEVEGVALAEDEGGVRAADKHASMSRDVAERDKMWNPVGVASDRKFSASWRDNFDRTLKLLDATEANRKRLVRDSWEGKRLVYEQLARIQKRLRSRSGRQECAGSAYEDLRERVLIAQRGDLKIDDKRDRRAGRR